MLQAPLNPTTGSDEATTLVRSFTRGLIGRRTFLKGAVAAGLTPALAGLIASSPRSVSAQDGGELTITLPRTIVALDPHGPQSVEETTAIVSSHIHDTLTFRNPETGQVEPRLAESWEQTDETTWTF